MDPTVGNTQVEITLNKPQRVVFFSDGTEEEFEEDQAMELKHEPHTEENVDPAELPWGPWIAHYAWKSSNRVLDVVDYAGESLANFFGITTPKYQLEIDEYERLQEEKRKMDDESAGWTQKNVGGEVPLVLNEPGRDRIAIV